MDRNGFFTMWFELIGFDHNQTAAFLGVFATGGAIGTLMGGVVADKMSRIYPNSGRVMCAQIQCIHGNSILNSTSESNTTKHRQLLNLLNNSLLDGSYHNLVRISS